MPGVKKERGIRVKEEPEWTGKTENEPRGKADSLCTKELLEQFRNAARQGMDADTSTNNRYVRIEAPNTESCEDVFASIAAIGPILRSEGIEVAFTVEWEGGVGYDPGTTCVLDDDKTLATALLKTPIFFNVFVKSTDMPSTSASIEGPSSIDIAFESNHTVYTVTGCLVSALHRMSVAILCGIKTSHIFPLLVCFSLLADELQLAQSRERLELTTRFDSKAQTYVVSLFFTGGLYPRGRVV
eukprot:TRINITY_DN23887_c1_g1_i1.p1 TRINITY_DN23887_c1_g1~~TRINITY_DN23887_c1_g1_i1.p1  ORF type:complete len:259 (+),score=71.13 TRINITY_DN23887_c1_g1_i1:52-777(+)